MKPAVIYCDRIATEEGIENRRIHDRARNAAWRRLVEAHPEEYARILEEERRRLGWRSLRIGRRAGAPPVRR